MGVLFSLGLGGGAGTVAAFDEKAESQKSLAFPSRHFAPPLLSLPLSFPPFHHNP